MIRAYGKHKVKCFKKDNDETLGWDMLTVMEA